MQREEIIQALRAASAKQKGLVAPISETTAKYLETRSEEVLSELLSLIERYAGRYVRNKLEYYKMYTKYNLEDIFQSARLEVFIKLKNDLPKLKSPDSVASFFFGIYRIATASFLREYFHKTESDEEKEDKDAEPVDGSAGESDEIRETDNKENPLVSFLRAGIRHNINIGEIRDEDISGSPTRIIEFKMLIETYRAIFDLHYESLMNYNTYFAKNISYYIAKIYPRIMGMNDNFLRADIEDAKKLMQVENAGDLSEESEGKIQEKLYSKFKWCEELTAQLKQKFEINGNSVLLKTVYIGNEYTSKQISKMVDSVDKHIHKQILIKVMGNKKLKGMVLEFADKSDFLAKFVDKDTNRSERSER